jgi:hypothetical protein
MYVYIYIYIKDYKNDPFAFLSYFLVSYENGAIVKTSFLCIVLNWILTPKIPGPFLPISTSKMLIFLKKSPKNKIK